MSNKAINRYCKEVGRQLICFRETKEELIRGLREELGELPPEKSDSIRNLEIHYGKIFRTACELQEGVPTHERYAAMKHRQRKRIALYSALFIIILLLSALIYFLSKTYTTVNVPFPPDVTSPDILPHNMD